MDNEIFIHDTLLEADVSLCQGVTIEFTRKVYSSNENERAIPEIIVSAGNITEPVTVR